MNGVRQARATASRLWGRRAEVVATLRLMAKGSRILGLRLGTLYAEIDLLALRGGVLSVVKVERRTGPLAALEAVALDQRERLRRAGRALAAVRPRLAGASVRLDLIALAPGELPRHIHDAWRGA
ncbi:MAG TPA: YraN family protein [Phenylobacterium sp.]|jgi:putative endonuclease